MDTAEESRNCVRSRHKRCRPSARRLVMQSSSFDLVKPNAIDHSLVMSVLLERERHLEIQFLIINMNLNYKTYCSLP